MNKTYLYVLAGALILSLLFNTFQYIQHQKDLVQITELQHPEKNDSTVVYTATVPVHKTKTYTKDVQPKKVDKKKIEPRPADEVYNRPDSSVDNQVDTLINHEPIGKDTLTVVKSKGLYHIDLRHNIEQVIQKIFVPIEVPFYEKPYFNFIAGFLSAVVIFILGIF